MSSEENQLPKPKRRWFQLRLRTFLVFVTLASGAFGWVGWELDQRRKENVAIALVRELGGFLYFDDRYSGLETSWWERTTNSCFGDRVCFLNLERSQISDLSSLAELKKLTELDLRSTEVSDLSPLVGLENVKKLDISLTKVSDLSSLAGLKNLEVLNLQCTEVSDLTPLADLKNLKSLMLERTLVSDLSPLAELTNLEVLHLNCPHVNDLSPLAGLKNVRDLALGKPEIKNDLSPLAGMTLARYSLGATAADLSKEQRVELENIQRIWRKNFREMRNSRLELTR